MIILCLAGFYLVGCTPRKPVNPEAEGIQVGGLYTAQDQDGKWRVMKVLAIDDSAIHLRSYANTFDEKPTDLDPSTLTLGSIDDPAGFGIGHFPIAKEGFRIDNPELLQVVPVTDDELAGYRLYQEATKLPDRKPESRPPK